MTSTPPPALVVTTISLVNAVLRTLSEGARAAGWRFVVIGDTKSPAVFELDGAEFYSVAAQLERPFAYARACPTRHYCRKNIGYLEAVRGGAPFIVETDDDNIPRAEFFGPRRREARAERLAGCGWVNVYRYFGDSDVWPRGLPLDRVRTDPPTLGPAAMADCPIQQGLADDNPDVDAVYRLVRPLPITFRRRGTPVALGPGAWCPFNSQNTTFYPDAYPLLYLPALCSFRMTDIWRSFVAQRVAWANGWSVLFHDATVRQERNEHNLMRDFEDEVPGYLHNAAIARCLDGLDLAAGTGRVADNVRACYRALVAGKFLPEGELPLLDAFLSDLAGLQSSAPVVVTGSRAPAASSATGGGPRA
ncbi:MAG: DUF288 domain-containing protein [Phycisphaerae bacterium]|nr:DUF288 domain-containing protein [Phycisphaerae bacterium]